MHTNTSIPNNATCNHKRILDRHRHTCVRCLQMKTTKLKSATPTNHNVHRMYNDTPTCDEFRNRHRFAMKTHQHMYGSQMIRKNAQNIFEYTRTHLVQTVNEKAPKHFLIIAFNTQYQYTYFYWSHERRRNDLNAQKHMFDGNPP